MNINELDSASLSDYIKFHDELNTRLWDRDLKLKADVRQALLTIADDFREFLGINDLEIKDITVSGSNAGYNYNDHSDIDLHLVVDLPEADRNQVYRELFDAKKYQYNDLRDITIGGYDVELYVQNANEPHYSQGIYSVLNDHWNIVPKKIKTPINDDSVISKYQDLEHRINSAVKQDNINKIQDLIDKIKNMRATGLAQHGEFGVENLTFKLLRSQGIIKKLYDRRNQLRDQQLSLTERKKRRSRRVKYGYTGYWYPGYSWSGGSAESGGGDGGGGESVNESHSIGDHIKIFATEIMDELGITRRPKIILHHDPQWTIETGSFGQYNPETNHLQLSVVNRHILDIIRTLAHELVHCAQRHRGRFPDDAGETGSPYEDEANALAGRILRGFADRRPELFQDMELSESSGYIPTEKEKNDPRFSMALTTDVRPGETGRQANKLNLKTDAQGHPALLMKKNQLREAVESPTALRIYLDMDGVLANFTGRYREMFGVDPTMHSRDDPHISKILGTDFFSRLDKFPTTDQVVKLAQKFGGGRYNICSSPLRGDHANSSDHKKQWLLNNLQPLPSRIVFTRNKEKYALTNDHPNVLIDDKPSNINKWRAAGGYGIFYDAQQHDINYLNNELEKLSKQNLKSLPKKQGVAEGTEESYPKVLYHGSTQEINGPLTPRKANDIGGHPGSNKYAIYATDDPNFAIAYGLAERGSDTGTFGWKKEPRLIFFGGKIRHGKDVYIHVLPTKDEQGRPLFTKGGADAEWYSVPGVEAITPIKVVTKPVDQYLHLLRKPTPEEQKIFQSNKVKKAVKEVVHPDILDKNILNEPTQKIRMGDFEFMARPFRGRIRGHGNPNDIGLYITAYDGKNAIGETQFVVKSDEKGNQWLESAWTEVDDDYGGRGVAAMMYAFAKGLGNDIKPSPSQSNFGKSMWKKWGKDAKHLVGEQGVAEGSSDDVGNIYALHPDEDEGESVAILIKGVDLEEFNDLWTALPMDYLNQFGGDLPLWDSEDLVLYPNIKVKAMTFDQYVDLVGNYIRSDDMANTALSKMKKGVAEGEVKLYTDPDYFGAEVDDSGFDSLPVVNIPANQLVGFEPDDKMSQPKSQANVKKIVAGLEKGDRLPPILVRKYKNGYQVLDGHHRFWAYKLLKIKSIPARIVPARDIEEISKQGVAEGTYNISDFKMDVYESMADFRKWMRSPKKNDRGMTRRIVDMYENIVVKDNILKEANQTFVKRKQQAKEFSENFKQFDERDKIQIKLGNKIALLSSTVVPGDISSRIELSGFTTPKKIVKINLDIDDKIDSIKFDDGSIFPESSEFTTVGGVNITNTIFFPDKRSASNAYTAIWMLISNLEGQGWKIEHYINEGVAEGSIKDLHIDLQDQQWDAIVGYVINGLKKNMDIGQMELNLYKYAGREMFDVDQALEDHGFESIADLADHIQQNNGRYVPPTFNLGEQDLAESLRIDVPNEEWLKGKIDYAKRRGRDSFGAPYFNSTTAYNDKDVRVPIEILRRLPGMRGEQQNVRQQDLQAIKKILKDTGQLPLGRDGKEYVPFVLVAYNGEAWVSEGNHRIMAAAELYDQGDMRFASLPIELKYFDGGERVESGPLHPSKISQSMSENFVNKVIQESFDQPYPIIWSRGEYGDVDGFTTLADGSRLELLFNLEDKESKQWMFQFYRDDRDDVSGQGDAQRVFATVLSALKIFLRRRRPNMLHFSASRETDSGQKSLSRSNLYTRLVQRYAPTWGYNVEIYDDGGRRVEYVLTPKVKQKTDENFADGKKPGRKGLAKRMGVPTKASVSRLRQIAKSSSGEKARMAHWLANMKAGKAKKS